MTDIHPHPAPNPDWLDLTDKVCVVTGAGSGIGRAVAQTLAAAGAKVAVIGRHDDPIQQTAQMIQHAGRQALAVACNVADEASVLAAAEQVRGQLGAVYGLVNNAGIMFPAALQDVSLEQWNQVLAVNLTGALLCARAFGRDMLAQGRGAIVHIASIAALHPQTRSGAYSASKSALLLLNRQLAAEWGPQGVRSNAICPGMIRTPLSEAFYQQPGFEERRAAVTASRRVGRPQDIAEPAAFLLSERASYVNGTELVVDGGLDCMLMDTVPRPGFN